MTIAMRALRATSLLLLCLCGGCGTLRHQTARNAPHATLKLSAYNYQLVDNVRLDGKHLPFPSRRVYRIAVGGHELKSEQALFKVSADKEWSETELALAPLIALGSMAASAMGFSSERSFFVNGSQSARESRLLTITFTAEAGQIYQTDGLVIWLNNVDEPGSLAEPDD